MFAPADSPRTAETVAAPDPITVEVVRRRLISISDQVDMNITRTDLDVHPRERKAGIIGQRPEERELFAALLGEHLVDVGRKLDPENPGLFTWWAPWRNMRERNIGWRLDHFFVSESLAARATSCVVQREFGTSDHGPVIAEFDL